MASNFPSRTSDGSPIGAVQDAPLRAADFLVEVGLKEEALLELDRAEIYYRAIIDQNPTDEAAVLAWIQLSSVESRRGRFDRAEEALTRARNSSASEMQARVLFILGVLQQEGRRDPAAAASSFQELAARFPESPAAPEALVRQAACLAETNRNEEALALLRKAREQYPRDMANGARALLLSARVLTQMDRWNEALSEYRALQADYPRSAQAIGSPFEIAEHYRQTGAEDAFQATLERAITDGDLMRDEHVGTPLARMAEEASIRALRQLGRWNEAVERLLRLPTAYPDDPRNPVSLIEAASILADRMGERERAAVVLEDVAERYPDSGYATAAQEQAQRLRSR
jgi:TolA-binding protein